MLTVLVEEDFTYARERIFGTSLCRYSVNIGGWFKHKVYYMDQFKAAYFCKKA